jgi:hypothetical protein
MLNHPKQNRTVSHPLLGATDHRKETLYIGNKEEI